MLCSELIRKVCRDGMSQEEREFLLTSERLTGITGLAGEQHRSGGGT